MIDQTFVACSGSFLSTGASSLACLLLGTESMVIDWLLIPSTARLLTLDGTFPAYVWENPEFPYSHKSDRQLKVHPLAILLIQGY